MKLNHKEGFKDSPQDPIRLSFPDLFEATQYEGRGPYRYNATFLIAPGGNNDVLIRNAIQTVVEEAVERGTFGKKADAAKLIADWEGNDHKFCYLDGDTKEYDGYAGMMYLAAHRKQDAGPPLVVDRDKTKLKIEDGKVYAGCYVNPVVEIYAQGGQNPGVRCSFSVVQFSRNGDAFSGGAAPNDDDIEDLGGEEVNAEELVETTEEAARRLT